MGSDLIKYELLLVVVALVVFAVWQCVSLKRDMEKRRREREVEEREAEEHGQAGQPR